MNARRILTATLFLAAITSAAEASEQEKQKGEDLVWRSVQIGFGESPETNKVGLSATADKDGLITLEITAFGYTFTPTPDQLAPIKEFPLESLTVARVPGDAKTGPVILFKFQHEYYDKVSKLLLIREEAILSVTRSGITVAVKPKKS